MLRAATPEEAWIATSPSSTDLVSVRVGDNLPSLGRVQAIKQIGDRWVVEASQGSVHEGP